MQFNIVIGIVRLIKEKMGGVGLTLQKIKPDISRFPDRIFLMNQTRSNEIVHMRTFYFHRNRTDLHGGTLTECSRHNNWDLKKYTANSTIEKSLRIIIASDRVLSGMEYLRIRVFFVSEMSSPTVSATLISIHISDVPDGLIFLIRCVF
jgi:hypothetical protein